MHLTADLYYIEIIRRVIAFSARQSFLALFLSEIFSDFSESSPYVNFK